MADRSADNFEAGNDLDLLVTRYLDGALDAGQIKCLNDKLRTQDASRSAFVAICLTRAGLIESLKQEAASDRSLGHHEQNSLVPHQADLTETMVAPALKIADEAAEEETEFTPTPFVYAPKSDRSGQPKWRAAAGILLALVVGAILWIGSHSAGNRQGLAPIAERPALSEKQIPPQTATKFAPGVLAQSIDADWASPTDRALRASSPIETGPHELRQGVIGIQFASGGVVVIQGPAQFDIASAERISLTSGRLCARIPHSAVRFTVVTPDMNAVDLGTEFGLDVTPAHQTYLEVFEGSVRAEPASALSGTLSRVLAADQAIVAVVGSKVFKTAPPAPLSFIRPGELQTLAASQESPYQRWQSFSHVLRGDRDLVAYYPLEDEPSNSDQVINQATATKGQYDGKFGNVGLPAAVPRWSIGRWSKKTALAFGEAGPSAVTFADTSSLIPSTQLTLGVWYRRTEASRAVHFLNGTVAGKTAFNVELAGSDGKPAIGLAPLTACVTWSARDLPSTKALVADDKWHFLAITADNRDSTYFYVDGLLVSSGPSGGKPGPALEQLVLGAPVNGNKDCDQRDFFHGQVDELMVFKRILSDQEILRIYQAGRGS